jgi:hypothetical protein
MPAGSAGFAALAWLIAKTQPGERRSLAIHFDQLATPATTSAPPVRRPRPGPGAIALSRATSTAARPTSAPTFASHQTGHPPIIDAVVDPAGVAAPLPVRRTALVAVTVLAGHEIDQHAAQLEHNAATWWDVLPVPAAERGFVAACLPLGIGPAQHPAGSE